MNRTHQILMVFVLTCFCFSIHAQNREWNKFFELKLKVLDSLTGEPLVAATAQISKHKHFHFTNNRGEVSLDSIKPGLNLVQVSYVGYHSFEKLYDIKSNLDLVLYLCPINFHLHEYTVHSHEEEEMQTENQSRIKLSSEQIQRSNAMVFSDLFKSISGVQLLQTGPIIAKPIIRGLHSNRIAIYNNGTKLESQNWGSEHAPELDPFAVAEIELIKGAASVEYGTEAIGGVIKIKPQAYRQFNGIDGKIAMNTNSNNGSFGFSNLLNGTHGSKRHFQWRLQSSYKFGGDSRTPNYVISNTGFNEADLNFSSNWQISEALGVEFSTSYFHSELGIMRAAHISNTSDLKRAMSSSEPLIVLPFTYHIEKPKQEVTHLLAAVKLNYHLTKNGSLKFNYNFQQNHRMEYDRGVSWNLNSITHQLPAYDLKLYSGNFDLFFEHRLSKRISGKIGSSFLTQSNISGGTQKPIIPNFIASTFGVFMFEKYQSSRWNFEAGMRYDFRSQSAFQSGYNSVVNEFKKQFSGYTFVASGAYHIHSNLFVQFTQSSAWRAPTVNELYSYGLHNGLASFEIGNANLVPEFSYNSDLAIQYKTEHISLEFNLYKNLIRDFIYASPDTVPVLTLRGAFPSFQFTQTHADLSGFELRMNKPIGRNYLLNVTYSYLHATDKVRNQALIYMPANRLKTALSYQYNHWKKVNHFLLSLDLDYVFRQNRFVVGLDYMDPPPAYWLIGLQSAFTIQTKQSSFNLVIGVKNLFNTSYRDYLNRFRYFTDEPGRNLYLSIQIPIQYSKSKI